MYNLWFSENYLDLQISQSLLYLMSNHMLTHIITIISGCFTGILQIMQLLYAMRTIRYLKNMGDLFIQLHSPQKTCGFSYRTYLHIVLCYLVYFRLISFYNFPKRAIKIMHRISIGVTFWILRVFCDCLQENFNNSVAIKQHGYDILWVFLGYHCVIF